MGSNQWDSDKSTEFLSPTLSRKHILKKFIFQATGSLKNKKVIEFGCGNGFWLQQFHKAGAKCVGVDYSKQQLDLAKAQTPSGIQYIQSDVANFTSKQKFDIVYIDHILSETASLKTHVRILKQAHSILKRNGTIILNEMHPSIAEFPFEQIKPDGEYFYFKSGAKVVCEVKQTNGKFIDIIDYHWTMQDFASVLKEAGFSIESIIEPRAQKSVSDAYLQFRNHFPSHIIIKARS